MAKPVRAAPDGAEGAQTSRVPELQGLKFDVDRLSSLEMQHRSRGAVIGGGVNVGDGSRDSHVAFALERNQPPGGGGRARCGVAMRHLRRKLELDYPVAARNWPGALMLGGSKDGEDGTADSGRPHPRQVEVAVRTANAEQGMIRAGEGIVVTIEYRPHLCDRTESRSSPNLHCRR